MASGSQPVNDARRRVRAAGVDPQVADLQNDPSSPSAARPHLKRL